MRGMLLVLFWCGCGSIVGSGNPASELREVEAFDQVEVTGMRVELDIGPRRVEVSGDDNLLPVLITEVVGRTLHIEPKPNVTLETVTPPTGRVTTPSLQGLTVRGGGVATATGVEAVTFEAASSTAGNLIVTGRAYQTNALATGAGSIDARGLTADHVKAIVTGSGAVHVCARETLDATVTGAGDIVYWCNPRVISRHVAGTGRLIDGTAAK